MVYDELKDQGFTVLAVALDSAGEAAAKAFATAPDASDVPPPIRRIMGWTPDQWETASRAQYPCLLDPAHSVAQLYDITNVPSTVWIDEAGRIVRPPEHAGAYDMLREIDLATFEIPDPVAKAGQDARVSYVDAVRDWVRNGADSAYALSPAQIAERAPGPNAAASEAAAQFQIGAWHAGRGDLEAARPFLEEAVRLRPESWTFLRQKIAVASADAVGEIAADEEYMAAVQALGERHYYEPFRP